MIQGNVVITQKTTLTVKLSVAKSNKETGIKVEYATFPGAKTEGHYCLAKDIIKTRIN